MPREGVEVEPEHNLIGELGFASVAFGSLACLLADKYGIGGLTQRGNRSMYFSGGLGLPVTPLEHPLRRRILRSLDRVGEGQRLDELAEELLVGVKVVRYHVEVLAKFDTLLLPDGRDGIRGLVETKPVQESWVTIVLEATEVADEWSGA